MWVSSRYAVAPNPRLAGQDLAERFHLAHLFARPPTPNSANHRLTLPPNCGECTNVVTKLCNLADRVADRCSPVRRYPPVNNILWSTPQPTSVYIKSAQKPNRNLG